MRKSIFAVLLALAFVACGDDNGTKVTEPADESSSSKTVILNSSSSSKIASSSSTPRNDVLSSSTPTSTKFSSSSNDVNKSSSSVKSAKSSSSKTVSLDSSGSSKIASSSSTPRNDVLSSSTPTSTPSTSTSLSAGSSSRNDVSSSSKIVNLSSSGKNSVLSSSRDYRPYAHDTCLAGNRNYKSSDYKTFVDPRNGRSYYYYTATSNRTGKSITVMAENLNIGEMVLGENDQNDDSKIERYCYNNDTTYCDHYGGLYQWAEMMQLPSRCNTESCAELIQENHRGICPEGWRLFTWDDYVVIRQYKDDFDEGIAGLRSQCFTGYNTSGFSLIGGGRRSPEGGFDHLNETAYWIYPQEHEYDIAEYAYAAYVSKNSNDGTGTSSDRRAEKKSGRSVRCTKLE